MAKYKKSKIDYSDIPETDANFWKNSEVHFYMSITSFRTVVKVIVLFSMVSVAVYYGLTKQVNKSYAPVYENRAINPNILSLAKIQRPKAVLPQSSSLIEWNAYLQKNFLRPSGVDHQDMKNMQQDHKHAQMTQFFNALSMVKDINPSHKKYDHIFVFGGTPSYTNERFKFLQQNIKNKRVYVSDDAKVTYINGHRKISRSEIIEAKNLGVDCEYQHQCAKLIWKTHYRNLSIKFDVMTIDAPEGRRANTDDTLKAFYAKIPFEESKKIKILGYSNQPYVPYQGDTAMAVAVKENRPDLEIEVVGGSSPVPVATITYLDSIARRVFTELGINYAKRHDKFDRNKAGWYNDQNK